MLKKRIRVLILYTFAYLKLFSQQDTTNPFYIKPIQTPSSFNFYNRDPFLKLPSWYDYEITYDTKSNQIVLQPKVGNLKISSPFLFDFEDYNSQKNKELFTQNWKKYSVTTTQTGPLDDFIPKQLQFDFKGLDKIFGSDKITITPTGMLDLGLGFMYYNNKNSSLTPRERRYLNFDFNMNVQIGVNGKVGDKLDVGINFNTQSMFDFENRKKIEYNGDEDEIIQKIEAGDVQFATTNSLISGSSTLFGLRTDMKFGRLLVSTVFSQQKGQSKSFEIKGSAVENNFEISVADYQEDQHFFLCHFFRDNYESALSTLPIVTSGIQITKIQVWVTNKTSDFENSRNIVAFLDLGENINHLYSGFVVPDPNHLEAYNKVNSLYDAITSTYSSARDITLTSQTLSQIPNFVEGIDYCKLENARLLKETEYRVNRTLGYISLNYKLRPGEILAVAFEYTYNGKTYKVGEFSQDVEAPKALYVKLLRGPSSNPAIPLWKLMMKNIYSLSASQISKENFSLEIVYHNDKLGTKVPFLDVPGLKNKRLLNVFNLDRTDEQLNANPDGFFDFIEGVTIDSRYGLIIFPQLEPFGSYLAKLIDNPALSSKIAFTELYDSTQYVAKQIARKNKFFLKGKFVSAFGSEIMLNAFNIPQGAVVVTQGGKKLTENVDYTVDYNIGRIRIINQSILNSGIPIRISLESNELWGMTSKSLVGTNLLYKLNNNSSIGATFLHMSELPIENKTSFGFEPISNSIVGMNFNYTKESQFLTDLVNLLPFYKTNQKSQVSFALEFARLLPSYPRYIRREYGVNGVTFIDPFEQSQTYYDITSIVGWTISSIPQHQPSLFPEATDLTSSNSGKNRALISWYQIPQEMLQRGNLISPNYMTLDDFSNHYVRTIYEKELFPNREQLGNIPTYLNILNIAYFPSEKGPYNFDVLPTAGISAGINSNGLLNNPASRWGGMMRSLYLTDFESSNITFLEFWLLDPFIYEKNNSGYLYINLGDISEDILLDGRKAMENAIVSNPMPKQIDTTQWGIISNIQVPTQNFNYDIIKKQDVGLDGVDNFGERSLFSTYLQQIAQTFGTNSKAYQLAIKDPANDDFRLYVGEYYDSLKADLITRFKRVNMPEGNSTSSEPKYNLQAYTLMPDKEDINNDNTLDNYEAYYQYKIHLDPTQMEVGKNYIVNKVTVKALSLPNGDQNQTVTWYQFKIPIRQPDAVIGQISGFKSIRFMRLILKGFEKPVILRFAQMRFVSDQWRLYEYNITEAGENVIYPQPDASGTLDVTNVNIEEHSRKTPVNYIMPPGVLRPRNLFDQALTRENEQSLALIVKNLPDGQSKAIYKLLNMDFRKFKRLQMHVHAEAPIDAPNSLKDYDLSLFVRFGNDFTENYYEYEIPLKFTPHGFYYSPEEDSTNANRYIVWPQDNRLDLSLEKLVQIKILRNKLLFEPNSNISINRPFIQSDGKNLIKIVGNPSLENVRVFMIGIRNPRRETNYLVYDDGLAKSAEIWLNELRLVDYDNNGGWASNVQLNLKLADLGAINLNGYLHTPGFGSVEKRVNERFNDYAIEYNLSSQIQFGKFFNKNYNVNLPLFLGFSQNYSIPAYNPFDTDVPYFISLDYLPNEQKSWLKNASQTLTQTKSINLSNVSIGGKSQTISSKKVVSPLKISNFSATIAYNEVLMRSPVIEYNFSQNFLYGLNYNWSPNTKPWEPLKKSSSKLLTKLPIIRDFNFYFLPTRVAYSLNFNRRYTTIKNRQIYLVDFSLPATFRKDFMWSSNFDFSYKITNNLRLDLAVQSQSRVEPEGWLEQKSLFDMIGVPKPQDTIFLFMNDLGRKTQYSHNYRINYVVPISKIPMFNWTTLNTSFSATYDWLRGQDPIEIPATDSTPSHLIDFGNKIQNSYTINLDLSLNFSTLYRNFKFLKDIDQRFGRQGRRQALINKVEVTYQTKVNLFKRMSQTITHNLNIESIKSLEAVDENGNKVKLSYKYINSKKILITSDTTLRNVTINLVGVKNIEDNFLIVLRDYTLKSLMMLRNVSVTYRQNNSSQINGFMPSAKFLGFEKVNNQYAPNWEYLLGFANSSIIETFVRNNWITKDSLFNLPMSFVSGEEIRGRVNLEPFNNVRIDLNFNRSINFNYSYYGSVVNNTFKYKTVVLNGNFITNVLTITTAFEKSDTSNNYFTKAYLNFLNNRQQVAQRLALERAKIDKNYNPYDLVVDSTGLLFPRGYNSVQQEVLTAAFLSAYTNISPGSIWLEMFPYIPFPDWRVSFDGLGNLPFIKEYVEKFTLNHAYNSVFSVNNFILNSNFDIENFENYGFSSSTYTNGNFIPRYEANGVLISEKFTPLIGMDIKWRSTLSTRMELRKSRDLFLSFSNNQIRERVTNGFTFGAGYIIRDLSFVINVEGQNQQIKSDLNIRLDVTFNSSTEILRKIVEQVNTLNTFQQNIEVNLTADYNIMQNLNVQFYFNDNFMKSNTSAPITNAKFGFKMRYTFR